nr:hypothetical protein [Tanacetum cinerariifolium]
MSTTKASPKSQLHLDDLEIGVTGFMIVMVCKIWDVNATPRRTVQPRSRTRTLDFYLANSSESHIMRRSWEKLIEKRTCHVGLYPVVLTSMSVKLYNNRLYLSSSSPTLIIDDDGIHALKQMKTDHRLQKRPAETQLAEVQAETQMAVV